MNVDKQYDELMNDIEINFSAYNIQYGRGFKTIYEYLKNISKMTSKKERSDQAIGIMRTMSDNPKFDDSELDKKIRKYLNKIAN